MLGLGPSDRGVLVGVIDIGTAKIVCLVIEARSTTGDAPARLRCMGMGHRQSAGVRGGVVVDPLALETAIRATVTAAERAARQRLEEVYISTNCGRLGSKTFAAKTDIAGGYVTRADLDRVHQGALSYAERDGRTLIHMNRRGYRLDGVACGADPRGMAARQLIADIHAVTADEGPVINLMHAVEAAHLEVRGLVAAPYAAGLAVTTEEERQLGVTVVDLGAGTTGLAMFAGGQFVHTEVFATGGHHLTFEIAKKFQAPLAEAERIKALYGSMVNASSEASDRFSYVLAGADDGTLCSGSRAELAELIEVRVADLVATIDARRRELGAEQLPVVLTGGGSSLIGIAAFMSRVSGVEVRVGRTLVLPGMPAGSDLPVFAVATGLVRAAVEGSRLDLSGPVRGGYLASVGRWLAGG